MLTAEFFAACIVQGLEYIHNQCIIHRDIKPENLVFDQRGYLKITDFGIARVWSPDNKNTSGTPGYMAPEVMCRQNHGVAVDYFALGVIVFECIFGFRPYRGKSRQEIRDQILAKQVRIRRNVVPFGWSHEACDFANKCLQRKPANRLGLNGPAEVKAHPWFDGFDWRALDRGDLQAPFVPDQVDNFDAKISNDDWNDQDSDKMKEAALLVQEDSVQEMFAGYYFDRALEQLKAEHVQVRRDSLAVHAQPQQKTYFRSHRTSLVQHSTNQSSASHS